MATLLLILAGFRVFCNDRIGHQIHFIIGRNEATSEDSVIFLPTCPDLYLQTVTYVEAYSLDSSVPPRKVEDDSLENSLAFWTTLETSRMQSSPCTILSWPRASSPSSINSRPLPLASRQNNCLLANLLPIRVPILKIQNFLYNSIYTPIVNF